MCCLATLVGMPETPMNKYHFAPRDKRKVRFSRQILPMEPEPVTHSVSETAHRQLGTHALAADPAHVLTAVTVHSSAMIACS